MHRMAGLRGLYYCFYLCSLVAKACENTFQVAGLGAVGVCRGHSLQACAFCVGIRCCALIHVHLFHARLVTRVTVASACV